MPNDEPASPPSDAELLGMARRLADVLTSTDGQLAVAESCTGGLLGHVITDVSPASDHFLGGVICYSNAVKEQLLGVPHALIEDPGPVSEDVAVAMLDGLFERFPAASLAVSVTGLAGPQGSSDGKPVGLTFVAAQRRGAAARVRRFVFDHRRDGNKRAAALAALSLAVGV